MINNNSTIFPECFILKSCPGFFELIDSKIVKYYIEDDDVIYYDAVSHYTNENLDFDLMLVETRKNFHFERIDIVLKALVPSMYRYLTDSINHHQGMSAIIRHEIGNTSDMILIWDRYGEDTLISCDLMNHLIMKAKQDPYKYMQIKNGKVKRIILDGMFIKL